MPRIYSIIFTASITVVIVAAVLLGLYGLNFGIDFKGGSVLDVRFDRERPEAGQLLKALAEQLPDVAALREAQFTPVGDKGALLRSGPLNEDEHRAVLQIMADTSGGAVIEESFESIGPSIGSELKTKSIHAIIVLLFVVVIYIAFVFRGMSRVLSPWAMGLAALVALAHDLVIPLGVFAVLGHVMGVQITAVFVAAVLTILGYSLSDTVVVFDRIRENILRSGAEDFGALMHRSVRQTVVRSLNTTATTLVALIAIWFFGGASLKYFALALIIGISLGAYSSIFVASPVLVWLSRRRR